MNFRNFMLCFTALALLAFGACKKDAAVTTGGDLTGSWKLISVKVAESTTSKITDNGSTYTTVGYNYYTTVKNAGVVAFSSGSALTGTGLAYSSPDTCKFYATTYQDGVLVGNYDAPFAFNVGPYNALGAYKVVGSDSLFITGGVLGFPGSSTPIMPNGGKYSISGNVLTMTSVIALDTVIQGSGQVKSRGLGIITMQKQ